MDKLNFITLRWISRISGKQKWLVFGMMLTRALRGFTALSTAWALKGLVDSAVEGSEMTFRFYAFAVAGIGVAQVVLSAVDRALTEYTVTGLECTFKERLLSVLLSKRYEQISAIHSAEWVNRLTSDVSVTASGFSSIFPGLADMLVRLIGAAGLLFLYTPRYMATIVPLVLIMLAFSLLFRKRLKAMQKRIQEADGIYKAFLTERLERLIVVKAFSGNDAVARGAGDRMREHRKRRLERNRFSNVCSTAFYLGTKGLYAGAAIYCGAGILRGSMSYGTFAAVTQLISKLRDPMGSLSGYLPRYYAMIASAERLMEAESFEDDIPNGEKSPTELRKLYDNMSAIELQGLTFSYQNKKEKIVTPVFDGFDLTIRKGESLALVGHSGIGKSTLLKLLMNVYSPDEGCMQILTDGGNALPLTSAERGLFAYVPQGNQLMSGTIREILTFGDEDAARDTERIRQALETACAWEFVSELEKGIDTLLGESGTGLSEGQLQRIAIARAVFSRRPVLLLDEATSALDEQTEARLLENLRRMTDCTVVIVTHRKAALSICEQTVRL